MLQDLLSINTVVDRYRNLNAFLASKSGIRAGTSIRSPKKRRIKAALQGNSMAGSGVVRLVTA